MGSSGAQAPDALAPIANEILIFKKYFSGFESPALPSNLRAAGVDTILLAGVHTHACIRETAAAAHAHGFKAVIVTDAVGSYDPDHAASTLDWIDGRLAHCVKMSDLHDFQDAASTLASAHELREGRHRNPCNWDEILGTYPIEGPIEITNKIREVATAGPELARIPIAERAQMLRGWQTTIEATREKWIDALVREVGKPRTDAIAEFAYGSAVLGSAIETLTDQERVEGATVRYLARGCIGLITPWNNPFAIPISKIAPAIGYGNSAIWKPSPLAGRLSEMIHDSLIEAGFGRWVALAQGGMETGRTLVSAPGLDGVSFTGSLGAGRQIASECGRRMLPLQAELGGNNAAIILADADLERAAHDLAGAMFSFSGQRCTAIRRIIVERSIGPDFTKLLVQAVSALRVGHPSALETQIGPLISKPKQHDLLAAIEAAVLDGARILIGGNIPDQCPDRGCWLAPTLIDGASPSSALAREESFGPLALLFYARDFTEALELHNKVDQGLLGAIYSTDKTKQAAFLSGAQAGILTINQARPLFSSHGPFYGWKASGFGPPEHGRWNREFYARPQAVYHD